MRRLPYFAACSMAFVLVITACTDDDGGGQADETADTTTTTDVGSGTGSDGGAVVFNGQGNHLDAYSTEADADGDFATQRVITSAANDPEDGLDINAQICFFADDSGRFIAGEDTGQPDPPAGFGIFELEGDAVGEFEATQVGKLTPTYQPGSDPENYGCGFLADGRVLTTDIGDQAIGPATGQLIVWFPPFDTTEVAYCKLDIELATAQSILVSDDVVFVAAARGGVFRYDGPFPTGPDVAGGCGGTDATGAPMAQTVSKSVWIEAGDNELATPAGLAPAPDGGMYVSSVFTGIINEYGADGAFVRRVLEPPAGEAIGVEPYSTGTPLGIGVGPDGTLYYADIGLVAAPGDLPGPGQGTGTVRRIVFDDGMPEPPEIMAEGLAFPDGIGVLAPGPAGGPAEPLP